MEAIWRLIQWSSIVLSRGEQFDIHTSPRSDLGRWFRYSDHYISFEFCGFGFDSRERQFCTPRITVGLSVNVSWVWGSERGDNGECCHMGTDAVHSGRISWLFREKILPPSLGLLVACLICDPDYWGNTLFSNSVCFYRTAGRHILEDSILQVMYHL